MQNQNHNYCYHQHYRHYCCVFKYFSVAGEVFLYIYLSDTSPAPEKTGKYLKAGEALYTLQNRAHKTALDS